MRKNPFEQLKSLLARKRLQRPLSLTEDHIRSVLLVRRARSDILGKRLFSDPAWDILLELYSAKLGGREMSFADLVRAIETPPSIAKRWIAALEEHALVQSRIDPATNLECICLTEKAADKIQRLADRWGSAFVSI
jgi:DNA-binding MarR family transcriptional regulator